MKKIYLLPFIICALLSFSQAQDNTPLISSISLEYQKATLENARGLALKADHIWKKHNNRSLQSGLMLSYLPRPGASPETSGELSESNVNVRLQVHTGYDWLIGQNQRWNLFAEAYLGLRSYIISGKLNQPNQQFDRSYSEVTTRLDFGTRLGLGYQITSDWSIQAGGNLSLIEINHPLRFYTGLFAWGPDAMALLFIGVKKRLE